MHQFDVAPQKLWTFAARMQSQPPRKGNACKRTHGSAVGYDASAQIVLAPLLMVVSSWVHQRGVLRPGSGKWSTAWASEFNSFMKFRFPQNSFMKHFEYFIVLVHSPDGIEDLDGQAPSPSLHGWRMSNNIRSVLSQYIGQSIHTYCCFSPHDLELAPKWINTHTWNISTGFVFEGLSHWINSVLCKCIDIPV